MVVGGSFRIFLISPELIEGYWQMKAFFFSLPYDMHGMTNKSELWKWGNFNRFFHLYFFNMDISLDIELPFLKL